MRIPAPPPTPREEAADLWHGERIVDPYRWLEETDAERTRAWTDAQNARTRAVLDAIPQRVHLAERLRALLAVGSIDTARPVGGRIFHTRREGAQRQAVLYVRDAVGGADRALVDPNALDASALITIDWYYPSFDARLVAYGLSRGGDEMSTLHVIEVATGRELDERIPHTQRSTVAWAGDGFYYSCNPEPGTVAPGDEHYFRRVRYHRLGDDPARDDTVFGEGRPKEDIVWPRTSPDGRWVLLHAFKGWRRSDLYLLDRERPDRALQVVVEGADGLSEGFARDDGLWLRTNVDAPNHRVVHATFEEPERWRTVVPEGEHSLETFHVTRDRVAVVTLERAVSRVSIWTKDGRREREVALPGRGAAGSPGMVEFIVADATGDLAAFTYQSFTSPPAAFAVDARTGVVREIVRLTPPAGFDPERFVVEQTAYPSKDGTEVTMFLVHRSDVRPTGDVPTVLNGYGGFNVSRTPVFSAGAAGWVEAGGLFAYPNLRGGGEYGERWHRDGMLERKQNVFDDFHAAAEALIARGWTRRERLGVAGGSNGGLLTGAALTQRPDLFGAVYCAVPLLDMLRYQNFLIARFWISEYGSAEDAEQYRWLRAYSPYHHVRAGVRYPPVLFTTAEGDSRVDPMHARKMAALLQAQSAEDPDAVVLLRVDRDAGHGVGKPLDKQVDDLADQYAFFAWRLGLGPSSAMLDRR
ncbi:MAG TPA: prolyl oligopeptidase family serine peptidase [Candidatus Limnocylindria bacterium]|nr:prolyl oligopeptidase family serine peptidase [Candidatus Limnocylindria bacterium]